MARSYYDARQEKLVVATDGRSLEETPYGWSFARTRFLVLREGETAFHGSLEELAGQRDPYLQKFLP